MTGIVDGVEIDALTESPQVKRLAGRFCRHLADEDFATHPPADIVADVAALIDAGHARRAGTAVVRVLSGHPGAAVNTAVIVVTDDMPFLVDSVTNALDAAGRSVQLVVHPQVVVLRDDAGLLEEILDIDVDDERPGGALAESWMWIELGRDFGGVDDADLVRRVEAVLHDVREVVTDWDRMRDKALAIADAVVADPPSSVQPHTAAESAELLRWLADDNFTFIGYREYQLQTSDGSDLLLVVPGTGLGILNEHAATPTSRFVTLPPAVQMRARQPELLILSKANSRSTVHRSAYLDYVGVKVFDDAGQVVGERRFLGLYSSSAYTQSVLGIPVLRQKYEHLLTQLDYPAGSHSAKDLLAFMETYPREELFQASEDLLANVAESVLRHKDRRLTRLYVRHDDYGRFLSCLVYLPRDRYTTPVRRRIEHLLLDAFGGRSVDYTARVTESVLARLHFVIRVPVDVDAVSIDIAALEAAVAETVRSWQDGFNAALDSRLGPEEASQLARTFADAFPETYKDTFSPERGVDDALILGGLAAGALSLELYTPVDAARRVARLRAIRIGPAMALSRVLPILQSMGVEVVDEYPYEVTRDQMAPAWILDFGMLLPDAEIPNQNSLAERFEEAFAAAWNGDCGVDGFNALVVTGGLRWRQAMILRAYARYMRQIGTSFSQQYIEEVVAANVEISRKLASLFEALFSPDLTHAEDVPAMVVDIQRGLDAIAVLDHDRIMRTLLTLLMSTVRTNYFQTDADGGERTSVAIKLDPREVPDIPLPRPRHEIFVYSPQVEGVHLRFGAVARGGIRWSDRQEDFRTEILGLVKAQEVKNAVIVPVGAKGGFVAKRLPDPSTDREGWLAEGKAAYRLFIRSLLDVTDNRVGDKVVGPRDVVRHDGDDPYLVVAADKGTAMFSDIANDISAEYGFWLGDAFASGGSRGYDHKAMGITARGAWESVKRHFRELGVNTQTEHFTVAGIGDMSGDVFGNGMLLSEQIRLVVAFDHRHIFVDPTPDAASSYVERQRLFRLPRSSWADYNSELISAGGGVFSRAAKSIAITPEMAQALALAVDVEALTPDELITAALRAPVDLLWNGGIGTYVKAQNESHLDVGDKANDRTRVNGCELRCKVVGEGGNLGFTQLGRVEAARHGVRLNTDAIDNSAGVDTSDHEVNIKIGLDAAARAGLEPDRNALLVSMTESVAEHVLEDNYAQNVVLANARAGAVNLIGVHQRLIRELERVGPLDRAVEFLPDDVELRTRRLAGEGLTSPELAVLLAYVKIWLTERLTESSIADDEFFARVLEDYFPHELVEQFGPVLQQHPLRSQIISTVVCNRLVNIAGISFVFRAMEETGADAVQVVRAAWASIEIFGIDRIWRRINAQDNLVPTTAQAALHLETRRLLDRSTRWFLQTRGASIDVQHEVDRFAGVVVDRAGFVPGELLGKERERWERLAQRFMAAGAPEDLAREAAAALDVFALLDITDICVRTEASLGAVLPLYFAISERYDIDKTLLDITALPRGDRWTALARQALRSDIYNVVAELTTRVLEWTPDDLPAGARLERWERDHREGLARARATLDDIAAVENPDLATLSVGMRALRNLVMQGTTSLGPDG